MARLSIPSCEDVKFNNHFPMGTQILLSPGGAGALVYIPFKVLALVQRLKQLLSWMSQIKRHSIKHTRTHNAERLDGITEQRTFSTVYNINARWATHTLGSGHICTSGNVHEVRIHTCTPTATELIYIYSNNTNKEHQYYEQEVRKKPM